VVLIGKDSRTRGFCEGFLPYSKRIDDAELFWNTISLEIYAQSQMFSRLIFACKK
jgi:hypothetical protein